MARSPAKADAISIVGASPAIADLFDKPGLREAVAGHDAVINLAAPMTSFSSLAAFLPGCVGGKRSYPKAWIRQAGGGVDCRRGTDFIQESFAPAYPSRGDLYTFGSQGDLPLTTGIIPPL
jgi:hypothetical protein